MDYQSNSDKDKAARGEKQVVKVITGEVVKRPETLGRKFKNVFFGGDIKSASRFVAADVVLPAFRDLLVDAIVNGAKGMIYGESSFRRRMPENRPRTTYSNPLARRTAYSDSYRDRERGAYLPDQPHPYRYTRDVTPREILLARKEDAEVVVENLINIVDKYEVASLADLYDLLGETSAHTDHKWGWTTLAKVDIRQTRDGYIIDLPPLEVI